jgi:plasmid stabilization system protein ParE
MKNFTLIVKQEADKEVTEAYRWYENKVEGLGERFLDALEDCYNAIDINPTTFQKIHKQYRQAILNTFPYVVIYEKIKSDIIVYAVFATAQHPNRKIR